MTITYFWRVAPLISGRALENGIHSWTYREVSSLFLTALAHWSDNAGQLICFETMSLLCKTFSDDSAWDETRGSLQVLTDISSHIVGKRCTNRWCIGHHGLLLSLSSGWLSKVFWTGSTTVNLRNLCGGTLWWGPYSSEGEGDEWWECCRFAHATLSVFGVPFKHLQINSRFRHFRERPRDQVVHIWRIPGMKFINSLSPHSLPIKMPFASFTKYMQLEDKCMGPEWPKLQSMLKEGMEQLFRCFHLL